VPESVVPGIADSYAELIDAFGSAIEYFMGCWMHWLSEPCIEHSRWEGVLCGEGVAYHPEVISLIFRRGLCSDSSRARSMKLSM
jgi:hypothetical protein